MAAAYLAFVVAALAIVVLMFVLALSVATAQERTVTAMQVAAPTVKKLGGRILVLVGTWFVALAIFADFFARIFPV